MHLYIGTAYMPGAGRGPVILQRFPGTEATDSSEPPCEAWKLNSSPLNHWILREMERL